MSKTSQNFIRHKLLATENMLRFGISKYFTIVPDYRYSLSNSDFTITMLLSCFTGGTVLSMPSATGASLTVSHAGVDAINVGLKTDGGAVITIPLQGLLNIEESVFRLTIIRRAAMIEVWINNASVATAALPGTQERFTFDEPITVGNADVAVSNLIFMTAAPLGSNMSELHSQNIVPNFLRRYVIAHYPLNELHSSKAWDISEQYNPGKKIFFEPEVPTFIVSLGNPLITTGTDADGNYVEYTAGPDSAPFGTPNLASVNWGGVYPDIDFDPYTIVRFVRGTVKLKLMGPSNNGFAFTIVGQPVYMNDVTDPVDLLIEKNVDRIFTDNSGHLDFRVDYRNTTPGMSVRIYSIELLEIRNVANHCILHGFTSQELGFGNLLQPSSWENVYAKQFKGSYSWRGNQVDSYAVIDGFGPVNYSDYTIAVSFLGPEQAIFSTYPNNLTHVLMTRKNGYDSGGVGIRIMAGGSIEFINGQGANHFDWYSEKERKCYVIVCKGGGRSGGGYLRLYANDRDYYESGGDGPYSLIEELNFSKSYSTRSTDTSRCVVLNRAVEPDEVKVLRRIHETEEYKRLSNIILDADFGNQYDGTYGRDYTGNYAIRFFNTTPEIPVTPITNKGLPVRNKALRFSNNHWIEIPGLKPTAERGYTHMFQFALDSDRNFSGYENILGLRDSGSKAKLIFGGTKALYFYNGQYLQTDTIRTNLSRLITVAITEGGGKWRIFVNGVFVRELFDEAKSISDFTAPFCIGRDSYGPYWFNGYMSFAAVWKGVLSDADIYSLSQSQDIKPSADCQLYLLFDKIERVAPIYSLTNISSGWRIDEGDPILTYGEDADGKYVEIQTGSQLPASASDQGGTIPHVHGRDYVMTWRMKILDNPYFSFIRLGAQPTDIGVGSLYNDPVGTVFDKVFSYTASSGSVALPNLYLFGTSTQGQRIRIYGITVEEADAYRIKDYSPQKNRVLLKGYGADEVNPGHANYAIVDRNTLR